MTPEFRPARDSEAGTIRRMVLQAGLDPTTLKWQNFLVAELDGAIIGVGQIKRYGDVQELGSLIVLPEYRGQGIARQLITELEAIAHRPLYLTCEQKMRPFYAQYGYREIPVREVPPAIRWKLWVANGIFRWGIAAMVKTE